MDARFSAKSVGLTGTRLSVVLAAALFASVIGLDAAAAHSLAWNEANITYPFVIGACLSALAGYGVVPILRRLKAAQFIREDGPRAHLKKAGTPTMGGIFFVPVAIAVALLWSSVTGSTAGGASAIWAVSLLTLAYGAIGWIDDWQVMRRRSNKGISPKMKLMLQIGFATAFCF